MEQALIDYDRAWNEAPKETRNAICQGLADDYVEAHPGEFQKYAGLDLPQLVALVDLARASFDEEERIRLDIYINYAFEYQQIGGELNIGGTSRRSLPDINASGNRRK